MEQAVGLRMRLLVSPEAASLLDQQSRMHGWWHNHLVERVKAVREGREDPDVRALLYGPYGLRNLLTETKEAYPFLRGCWTYSLQCVAMRMTATIKTTRSGGSARGEGPWAGWPSFHRWSSHWAALEYHALTGGYTLADRTLTLTFGREPESNKQETCSVEFAERLPGFARPARVLSGEARKAHPIRGVRIIQEHGVYYAVLTVKRTLLETKALPEKPRIVSLDPHHYSLAQAVDTDGISTRIPYPPTRQLDRRIDQLKARRDTCVRTKTTDERGITRFTPSRRWTMFDQMIEETQRRREAIITQYLYEVANWLYRHYDVVAVGDYRPQVNKDVPALNRWILAQSLVGRLRGTLSWMAVRSGKRYYTWPEEGTTRTCADCAYVWVDGIPTRMRYYTCPGCGRRQRRNENNARMGLATVLEQLNLLPGPGRRVVQVAARRTYRSTGLAALRRGPAGRAVRAVGTE